MNPKDMHRIPNSCIMNLMYKRLLKKTHYINEWQNRVFGKEGGESQHDAVDCHDHDVD